MNSIESNVLESEYRYEESFSYYLLKPIWKLKCSENIFANESKKVHKYIYR